MKKNLVGKLLCALVVLAPVTAVQAKLSDGEVRIGLVSDMSSVYGAVGRGAVVSAEMAIEDFGGKVLGKRIRLYERDHQSNTEVGMKHAKELHEQHNVDAYLEMVSSSVAVPMQQYARENKIMTLHTGAASSILTGRECSPYGVHWVYDTYALAAGSATALTQQGGDSWFFVTADYTFGKILQEDAAAVVQKNGGTVLGSALHPFKGTDFMAQLVEAKASGAKVVALANAVGDTITAVRQAYELDMMGGDQIMAGLLVDEFVVGELGLYAANGLKFTTGWYWDLNEESRAWAERFSKRSGMTSGMVTAGVYSVVMHYLKAIEAAGTDDPDAVMAKMREIPVNDMFATNGKVRIDGLMVHDMYLAEVKNASESRARSDYFKILATIPGDQAFRPLEEGECPHVLEMAGKKN